MSKYELRLEGFGYKAIPKYLRGERNSSTFTGSFKIIMPSKEDSYSGKVIIIIYCCKKLYFPNSQKNSVRLATFKKLIEKGLIDDVKVI